MMYDLISRKDAVSRISDLLIIELKGARIPTWNEVYNAIGDVPSVPAVPAKHGRWKNIANSNCDDLFRCSECKETWLGIGGYNYRPNCGAKMDLEEQDA